MGLVQGRVVHRLRCGRVIRRAGLFEDNEAVLEIEPGVDGRHGRQQQMLDAVGVWGEGGAGSRAST